MVKPRISAVTKPVAIAGRALGAVARPTGSFVRKYGFGTLYLGVAALDFSIGGGQIASHTPGSVPALYEGLGVTFGVMGATNIALSAKLAALEGKKADKNQRSGPQL